MTNDPLPEAAEASRLTDALRRYGVLSDGCVSEVAVESSRATVLSRITRLRLAYDRADVDAPRSVILKTGLPERAGHGSQAARQEIAFYTQVASAIPALPVPR